MVKNILIKKKYLGLIIELVVYRHIFVKIPK